MSAQVQLAEALLLLAAFGVLLAAIAGIDDVLEWRVRDRERRQERELELLELDVDELLAELDGRQALREELERRRPRTDAERWPTLVEGRRLA